MILKSIIINKYREGELPIGYYS